MHSGALKTTAIGGLAVAIAVGLVGVAGAEPTKVPSRVELHGLGPDPTYNSWVGDVHSRKRKCERRRTVTVYYEELAKPQDVGSDTTDRDGHWAIPIAVPGDDPYYAVVSRRVIGRGSNKLVCKADRSPRFGLPPL